MPKADRLLIGATLKTLRLEQHLTQAQLAERAGIGRSYLSEIEADLKEPTGGVIKALATALGVPIGVFFETPGSSPSPGPSDPPRA